MTQNGCLSHMCMTGDLILVGLSRRHPDKWMSAGLVVGNSIIHSVKTQRGHQAVRQDFQDFLEHQGKPLSLLRCKPPCLGRSSELLALISRVTETRPSWIRKVLFKEKSAFLRSNSIDISRIVMSYLGVSELSEITELRQFDRLH